MISTVRLAENNETQAFESIFENGLRYLIVVMWLSKNFIATVFKCGCNKGHRKIS